MLRRIFKTLVLLVAFASHVRVDCFSAAQCLLQMNKKELVINVVLLLY